MYFNMTKTMRKEIEFIPINVGSYKDVKLDEEIAADEELNSTRKRFEERINRVKEYEDSLLAKNNKHKTFRNNTLGQSKRPRVLNADKLPEILDHSVIHQGISLTQVSSSMFTNIKSNHKELEQKKKERKEEEQMAMTIKSKRSKKGKAESQIQENTEDEVLKIDFKENIVNEFHEVNQTIQPTFGVALVMMNDNGGNSKRIGTSDLSVTKVNGKRYNQIPNLKTNITRKDYLQIRDLNNQIIQSNRTSNSIDYKINENSGFISTIKLHDDNDK